MAAPATSCALGISSAVVGYPSYPVVVGRVMVAPPMAHLASLASSSLACQDTQPSVHHAPKPPNRCDPFELMKYTSRRFSAPPV